MAMEDEFQVGRGEETDTTLASPKIIAFTYGMMIIKWSRPDSFIEEIRD